ncbi:MAG: CPBP family intramembrane glutamic endopeptidase [Bacteroidales bacterium]
MNKKRTIRNIILFTIIVILSGWIGLLIDNFIPEQPEGDSLGMGIWLVLPLLTVVVLRTFAGDGWKDAGLRPRLKKSAVWYMVSFFIFPVVTAISVAIGKVFGWIDISGFSMTAFIPVFFGLLIIGIIKNIFEESVWRGYLTAKLLKFNISDLSLYLIVGLIWSVWHMPYFLEFLPEATITSVLPVSRMVFFLVGTFTMVAWTVMFVEIYRLTNSIWPVVLLHAVEDSLINPLVIDGHISIVSGMEIFISPICGIIPTSFYLLTGLWLRKRRILANKKTNK